MTSLETPILFIIFNRPDVTKRVFEEIRKARPTRLFIAADGPRKDNVVDIEACRLSREVVEKIDWPCEAKKIFRTENLGCKIGVSSAITWFFDQVEEGIVLEDDCLPDQSFFRFCTELLGHYRNDARVGMICGYNKKGSLKINESYAFSQFGHIWGWASWKRAWQNYDVDIKSWADKNNQEKIKAFINNRGQWKFRNWIFNIAITGKKDTWDYQWDYARLIKQSLSVIPAKNLIQNIGFDERATHTKNPLSELVLPSQSIDFPLVHPASPVQNKKYDAGLKPRIFTTKNIWRKIKSFGLKL